MDKITIALRISNLIMVAQPFAQLIAKKCIIWQIEFAFWLLHATRGGLRLRFPLFANPKSNRANSIVPFCRAARCTGNYDLRLTIGRNARAFPPLPTISRTNAKLDLVHRSDHYWAADMFPTFSWSRSRASWSPTAFMSVLCSADVTYMCMSRNLEEGLMVSLG